MRPAASTAVASMQNAAAPDSASELIWVKCQSLASPFSEEYWHIGATMMRLGNFRPRRVIGENRALIWGSEWEGKVCWDILGAAAAISNCRNRRLAMRLFHQGELQQ